MQKKLLVLAIAVALVISIFAGYSEGIMAEENLEKSLEVAEDIIENFKASDGYPLVSPGAPRDIPERPDNPREDYPEEHPLHWWDLEFAGWDIDKVNMPESPADGAIGKEVVLIRAGDHPYWTSYVVGFEKVAEAYDMDVHVFNSNWNMDLQAQQTQQAINMNPDMIIFAPVDATAATRQLRQINRAGIPVIASNTLVDREAMQYVLSWTGPDDFGQFRMLAREFADELGKEGGYAIVRHMPGASPFFARTFGPITELKDYAPDMELLAKDSSGLEAEPSMQLVSDWLSRFGEDLQGLILAGDGPTLTGTIEALEAAGREDVVVVAAGNSGTGMRAVQEGQVFALTYQTAEGDGAIALQTAADWFNGKDIDPVVYLPREIITADNVDDFMPPQW